MPKRRMLTDVPNLEWCGQYVLGGEDGHTPIPCYSIREWGQTLSSMDRRVAWTGGQENGRRARHRQDERQPVQKRRWLLEAKKRRAGKAT